MFCALAAWVVICSRTPPPGPARPRPLSFYKDYNNAVDMWSLGCILAELLSMQKESFPTSQERNALFPGKSCFPLSAEKPSSYTDALDQLNVIFDVIGTPCEEDTRDLVRIGRWALGWALGLSGLAGLTLWRQVERELVCSSGRLSYLVLSCAVLCSSPPASFAVPIHLR